jgi:methionine-rich copper-binding protein CopC
MDRRMWIVRGAAGAAMVAFTMATGRLAEAHAILKESSPAANAIVTGPDVPIALKYNSRVDATRSKVQLLRPDSSVTDLKLEKQAAPDTLTAKATGLTPGEYKIQWQVLSPDGHITRGIVPFAVKAA